MCRFAHLILDNWPVYKKQTKWYFLFICQMSLTPVKCLCHSPLLWVNGSETHTHNLDGIQIFWAQFRIITFPSYNIMINRKKLFSQNLLDKLKQKYILWKIARKHEIFKDYFYYFRQKSISLIYVFRRILFVFFKADFHGLSLNQDAESNTIKVKQLVLREFLLHQNSLKTIAISTEPEKPCSWSHHCEIYSRAPSKIVLRP